MIYERRNILLYVANIIFLFFGLAVLVWLRTRFASDLKTAIESASSLFSQEEVLKSPDDVRINFGQIEHIARRNKNIYITDIVVSKILQSDKEIPVYPFYLSAIDPQWKQRLLAEGWHPVELAIDGEKYGMLYLRLNKVLLNGIKFAIWSFAFLLCVSVIILLWRLYRQEQVISAAALSLKEKNQELMRLERLALAGQLTANIFHDIKKPVLNIKHSMSDLQELCDKSSSPELTENINNIQQQVDLFFSILNELGIERFVRASNQQEEYVDVNDLLKRSCNLVRYEQRHTKLIKELASDLPPIYVNPYKLIQVFSNIILNAYQAMDGKGVLRVRTALEGKNIMVEIIDNGPGIQPEHLPHLFTPFFTTKDSSEGAGLGLYISKNIIGELGGAIKVESKPGCGATFRIILPVRKDEQHREESQTS